MILFTTKSRNKSFITNIIFFLQLSNNIRLLYSFALLPQQNRLVVVFPHQPNHFKSYIPKRKKEKSIFYNDSIDSLHYLRIKSSTIRSNNQDNNDSNEQDDNNTQISTEKKESRKKLKKEFLSIALPALIQLAAEPLAGLVDTAYLGRLGPEVLGGAGVAISAQYAISKLYNDPLLRTSISLVAAQDGKSRGGGIRTEEEERENAEKSKDDLEKAVSSALLLALSVGLLQLFIYFLSSNWIISGPMGVTESNSMWYSATTYLRVRALGTPASTLWLVANGVFRGLGDTTTPLVCSFLFTGLNVILDPIFIFTLGFGASGAAAGTAIAQYIALVPLLILLYKRVKFNIRVSDLGSSLKMYLDAGILVLVRSIGKVLAYSVCAREAALLGPIAAAAYNLTFTLGFATTQICESIAIAVQTLLARLIHDKSDLTTTTKKELRRGNLLYLMNGSILVGGFVSCSLSLFTFLQRKSILNGLTNNLDIQQVALQIFPAVLLTQVLKGLAYPVNGIIMGALDWNFTMIAMWLSNFTLIGMMYLFKSQSNMTLINIWWSLAAFMGVQVISGIGRMYSGRGIWKEVKKSNA